MGQYLVVRPRHFQFGVKQTLETSYFEYLHLLQQSLQRVLLEPPSLLFWSINVVSSHPWVADFFFFSLRSSINACITPLNYELYLLWKGTIMCAIIRLIWVGAYQPAIFLSFEKSVGSGIRLSHVLQCFHQIVDVSLLLQCRRGICLSLLTLSWYAILRTLFLHTAAIVLFTLFFDFLVEFQKQVGWCLLCISFYCWLHHFLLCVCSILFIVTMIAADPY